MRVAKAAVVALLILNFVDEHFNDARYTRATTSVLSKVARSFGWASMSQKPTDISLDALLRTLERHYATMPRGSFGQTEFLNHLDCRNGATGIYG
jgi:hypothetical protein